MNELTSSGKPFAISKREVWEAYERVKANKGAPGVDGCSIEEFEADLKNNLYKIWNRMSSGSYFPPPVRAVEVPKPHGGGVRVLGVPTVADRIAQTVGQNVRGEGRADLPPRLLRLPLGPVSTGAVAACRKRCWKTDWVLDLDIQKFFDSVPWDLVVKAVEANTDDRWVVLYVQRWLQAPVQLPTGALQKRDRGTPQGSAVSPVLANLFLHYAFDSWMAREHPAVAFERYVDDAVVHCVSEAQAHQVMVAIAKRMEQVGLRLHPDKTKIVYCQDGTRRGSYEHTAFTFLGFTFRQRRARNKHGRNFNNFLPAISKEALKRISTEVRSWRLHRRTGCTLNDLARRINPIVAGWMHYYGAFYRSALYPLLSRINAYLMGWIRKKYKRLRNTKKARVCWRGITERYPQMFTHWKWTASVQHA